MAVRFKFRSCPTFDSIDIGAQSSISIRDLKSQIVKKKHLNLSHHDFDLVFSDSLSGHEYKDENLRIPSGSSVIIKRVPATSTPLPRAGDVSAQCFGGREANHVNTFEPPNLIEGASVLDDLGVDLCPLTDANHLVLRKPDISNKKDCMVPRCPDEQLVRCHKISQSTQKDSSANEGSTLVMQSKPLTEEPVQLGRKFPMDHLAVGRSDVPSELKCSLCRKFFKDAVMIPCCQHSFCEKCIHLALAENSKCPMCLSTKCKVGDLLPNVSLRQAIERFLESQLLPNGSENDLHRYAPDGESGIQVELSHAASVTQRQRQLNHSASWKRSNRVMQNDLPESSEFQGENDPQNIVRDEEDSCTKIEGGFRVITGGGERNFTTPSRLTRGQRTCYMCGSPDHLIRDCPVASSSRANHWNGDTPFTGAVPGCQPQYWPGTPPNIRPFVDMYGGPQMMMYNTTMAPIPSFVYPCYAPSTYAVYPVPSTHMRFGVGGMAPPMANNGPPPSHSELLQSHEKHHKNDDTFSGRGGASHQVHDFGMHCGNLERGVNYSDDSLARRSEGKHRCHEYSEDDTEPYSERKEKFSHQQDGGRQLRFSQTDKSTSQKDLSHGRIHPMEERHEKLHRSSRANDEGKGHGSYSKRESVKRERGEHGRKLPDREYSSHSRSSMEHSYSGDGARKRRDDSSHRSRHPKKGSRSNDMDFHHNREKNKYSDEDYGEYNHDHKRKRYH